MSTSVGLIAAETGKMSLCEKKASIAESHTSNKSSSSSSSPSSASNMHHCPCPFLKNNFCCHSMFANCHLQPCLIPQWGVVCMIPPCYNQCFATQKCCQTCPTKNYTKKCKAEKVESVYKEEKICNCCKEGKCDCCKSGKECGKDDDNISVKSDKSNKSGKSDKSNKSDKSDKSKKSDAGSDDEGAKGDKDEKDDETGGGYSHSVAQLIHRFSKEV